MTRNSVWKAGVFCAAGLMAFCSCFQSSGWISARTFSTRDVEVLGIDAEDAVLAVVPQPIAGDADPNPTSPSCRRRAPGCGAARSARSRAVDASSSAVRSATRRSSSALSCSSCARLAIELDENPDLGAQHLRNDRHRHVVDGAHLVAAQAVDVGQMDGGDEDDRGLLEPRMLADHRRQLEAVEVRHADVHQDDGDLRLQQLLERLRGRTRP